MAFWEKPWISIRYYIKSTLSVSKEQRRPKGQSYAENAWRKNIIVVVALVQAVYTLTNLEQKRIFQLKYYLIFQFLSLSRVVYYHLVFDCCYCFGTLDFICNQCAGWRIRKRATSSWSKLRKTVYCWVSGHQKWTLGCSWKWAMRTVANTKVLVYYDLGMRLGNLLNHFQIAFFNF